MSYVMWALVAIAVLNGISLTLEQLEQTLAANKEEVALLDKAHTVVTILITVVNFLIGKRGL